MYGQTYVHVCIILYIETDAHDPPGGDKYSGWDRLPPTKDGLAAAIHPL